ncbi:phage head closure protein [Vagococcus carniphilus]|uniref:phage head closure protein n=1 Tax=Vagococcus carniphilus TaxID=218144 RepID=UPI00288F7A77|nr:phage head closure protein [Vagococcus carniphilus]MDT2850175.1 phage head closure protein [Vagococcus carniphilus]
MKQKKRLTNRKRWVSYLYQKSNDEVDKNDRPINTFIKKRKLFYDPLAITSEEKYLSKQNKKEVVKRIEITMDRSIDEIGSRVEILGTMYSITRIWHNEVEKKMELSLAYVDNKKGTE